MSGLPRRRPRFAVEAGWEQAANNSSGIHFGRPGALRLSKRLPLTVGKNGRDAASTFLCLPLVIQFVALFGKVSNACSMPDNIIAQLSVQIQFCPIFDAP